MDCWELAHKQDITLMWTYMVKPHNRDEAERNRDYDMAPPCKADAGKERDNGYSNHRHGKNRPKYQ